MLRPIANYVFEQPFLHRPFHGKWYLETKICLLGVLIVLSYFYS